MTVTNTSYTTNSYKVNIVNEFGSTNIMAGVDTAITALGWTQYDVVDVSTFSPIKTYVYRVLNADATTYKYFILRFDTINLIMYTSCCEGWNTVTHVTTNECWTGVGAFAQHYDIKDSFIFVSATARHILIWPFIRNEPGMWTGVFEFERIVVEDTPGSNVPCFAWTNSVMVGTPNHVRTNIQSSSIFAFPRTADGSTGAAAASAMIPTTGRGMYPPYYPQYGGMNADDGSGNYLHLGSYFNMTYGWNSTKTVVSPISADGRLKSMPIGRMYNVGVTKSIGSFLDTTYINLDNSAGWPDSAGTSTECLLLPMNGGHEYYTGFGAGQVSGPVASAALTAYKAIGIGGTIWGACSDGVRTWPMDSGQGSLTTLVYSSPTAIIDIAFDGSDFIYASNAAMMAKIQVSNTSNVSTLALAQGATQITLDNKYIYTPWYTTTIVGRPGIYFINKSTFSSPTSNTSQTSAGGNNTNLIFSKPAVDYAGNVYVTTTGGQANGTMGKRLSAFNADNTNQTANVYDPLNITPSTGVIQTASGIYVDPITARVFYVTVGPTAMYTYGGGAYELTSNLSIVTGGNFLQLNSSWNSNAPVNFSVLLGAAISYSGLLSSQDYRGDLQIMPRRGSFFCYTRNSANPVALNVLFNSPQTSTPYPITAVTSGLGTTPGGWGVLGGGTTNGPRTFYSGGVLGYVKNFYNTTNIAGGATGRLTLKA